MNTVSQKVVERLHVRVPDSGFAAHVNISKRWQYNGAAPFNDIVAWCFQHFGSKVTWSYLNETIYFRDEREYTLFLLRWA